MSESSAPVPPQSGEPAGPLTTPSEAPAEWRPEPREWGWKDLFTAPMLAFKPTCMLVSAATVVALLLWWMLLLSPISERGSLAQQLRIGSDTRLWYYLVVWLWTAVSLAVGGLGAALVSVFLKADLLDDEFLSLKEALGRCKARVLPAAVVPVFLLVLATGFWALLWLAQSAASIPYLGPALYVLLYPLAFAFSLLAVLVTVAAALGLFLAPGIVATREHGWFDNVVDAIEAVGTKPHQLAAGLAITGLLALLAWTIGNAALGGLNGMATGNLPFGRDNQIAQTETAALAKREGVLRWISGGRGDEYEGLFERLRRESEVRSYGWWTTSTGWGVAGWQLLITALLTGYCANLALSGGLLTYLWVREDDYWDDEDLQDLDQLAKELEEEAKREEAQAPKA